MNGLLNSNQAAELLQVDLKILRRFRESGEIRYIRLGERKILYRPEDLAAFVETRAIREKQCRPTNRKIRKSSNMISGGKVIAFTARRDKKPSGQRIASS